MVRIRQRREILVEACRLATSVGGYASAMVALIEPGTRTARPAAWSGSVDQQHAQQLTFTIADSEPEDTSVIGRVLRTGTSLVCNDLQITADAAGGARRAARLADFAASSRFRCWWTARRSAR